MEQRRLAVRWPLAAGLALAFAFGAAGLAVPWPALTIALRFAALGALLLGAVLAQALAERAMRAMLKAQQEADARYRDIFENATEGIAQTTADGRILVANPAYARFAGYDSVDEMLRAGADVRRFWDDPQERALLLAALQRDGEVHGMTMRGRRRNGELAWIRMDVRAHRGPGGAIERLDGFVRDVTAEREAQRARDAMHARYASLVEDSMEGIMETTPEGQVRFVNASAARMLGFDSPRHMLASVANARELYLHAPERERFLAHVRSGSRSAFEVELRRRDGTPVPVAVRANLVQDQEGPRVQSFIEDITERRAAEAARRELDLKEAEVHRLEELGRTRLEFLNTAAHDLKTPLTPIKLQLSLLRRNEADARQKERLDVVARNVTRFEVLVQDMLDAARLQAGRLKVSLAPVPLREMVQEAVEAFQEPANQAGQELLVTGDARPNVLVDRAKSLQVLFNLVSNAVKYTPPGGRIEVGLRVEGARAVVRVADSGLGMTHDQLGQLFQPFVRLHEGLADVAPGTGLGLYISKGIAETLGGTITATSLGPGQGSAFELALPIAAAAQAAA